MCNHLKLENLHARIKDQINVYVPSTGSKGKAQWDGFAQMGKLGWWLKESQGVNVCLPASTFNEQGVEFNVPGGVISGIGLRKDVVIHGRVIGKAKSVKIVTREARNAFERKIHGRFPVVINNGEIYEFGSKDVVKSDKMIQEELFNKNEKM